MGRNLSISYPAIQILKKERKLHQHIHTTRATLSLCMFKL
jgi:hypothetical protein